MNNNNNSNSNYFFEEIKVTLTLKKNIAFVRRLISYQQNKSFNDFVSEEVRQAILSIGPNHLNSNQSLKEYAQYLLEGEEV